VRASVYVLEHTQAERLGVIAEGLAREDVEARPVRIFAGEPIPSTLDGIGGLVVMGGPMGVYEHQRYGFLRAELRLIEQALAREVPVLGVCLGSQLLAHTLGAHVAPAPQKEIGWFPVTISEHAPRDTLLADVEPSFVPFHWHGDAFDLPAGAVPLAASTGTPLQAFRYGSNAYGFLFHMEVTEDIVRAMVDEFSGEITAAKVDRQTLLDGIDEFLPRLESIGEMVFGRWAALVR
jgi:GMP synthase (glutamine-hydrolysing)